MKKNVNKSLWTLLITILLLSTITLLTIASVPNEPHDADSMWVEPSSVDFSLDNASIGDKFNITVWLNITSDDVFGYQVVLYYNRTLLAATDSSFTAGSKSEFMGDHETSSGGPTIDTSVYGNGSVLAFESCKGDDYIPAAEANGSLIWIEFEIIAEPSEGETLTSALDISTAYPADTFVQNYWLEDLPITTYDGTYTFAGPSGPIQYELTTGVVGSGTTDPPPGTHMYSEGTEVVVDAIPDSGWILDHWLLDGINVGANNPYTVTMDDDHTLTAVFAALAGTRIFVDPPEIIDPTMQPSSTFAINITLDDVGDLTICEFNLTYDSNILSWVGINILKVQGQTPSTKMTLDDEAGFIWVKLTYSTPITTEVPIPIMTVQFHVDALGCTPLDLHDTQLIDSGGEPMTHETFDGFFCTLIRDVAITNVVPSRSWVYQGWNMNITVTAKNKGDITETFSVTAYYDSNLIGNITIENLPPSNETTVIFTWDTTDVTPCNNYTISAQASTVPSELNTADNTYIDSAVKVRLLGDVNGDGSVDGRDLILAASAFASYGPDYLYPGSPPHPRWNPDTDINDDNVIDGRDLIVIARNFGKNCPL